MTLTEISKMTYDVTTAGYVNDVKFHSYRELRDAISHWLYKDVDFIICQLALPDGRWFCRLSRNGDYYDLYIPDTREQESWVLDTLLKR